MAEITIDYTNVRNPQMKKFLEEQFKDVILSTVDGHDHDGSNSKLITADSAPADGSVTNAKLATDVKVGSLAALTPTANTNVVEAINEVDAHADAANTSVGTLANLTTTAKTDLVVAINEIDTAASAASSVAIAAESAADAATAAVAAKVSLTGVEVLTNKTLTSPTLTTPLIDDTDAGVTITSANQTNASATVTIPDIADAADAFVMADTAQTLTNKTLTSPVINTPNFPDDSVITVGTTTATAETKMTMEFDETTTGIGLRNIGTAAVPQILNASPGATVMVDTINVLHSAGIGDCDDLIGAYKKVAVTGDGDAGLTIVGDAPRAYVGAAAEDTTLASAAYASQPWAKHDGTGAITAMSALSALCDVNTCNFTANTVNAIHAHVEGAATVTGQFDAAHLEVYPDVTSMDSVLHMSVDTGAVVQDAIKVSGAVAANFINVEAASTGVVVAAGSTLAHDPNAVTSDAYLVVKVGAVQYALPLYQIA